MGGQPCFVAINESGSRAIESRRIRHVTRRTDDKVAREAPPGKLRHISSSAGNVFETVSPIGGVEATRRKVLHNIPETQQNHPTIYNPVSGIAQLADKGISGG